MRILRFVLVAGAVAACAGPAPDDLIPVPTSAPVALLGPTECPAGDLDGELLADEEFGFVVANADGFSSPVTWPNGYVAREVPRRELLDESGRVVAREGDFVSLGGGEGSAGGVGFVVCGQFEVTPAR